MRSNSPKPTKAGAFIKSKTSMDTSPFTYIGSGIVEPFSDFKVDNFYCSHGKRRGFFAFFLSHMHEDHLKGLTRMSPGGFYAPDEDWDYGTIYTSPISKALLLLRFPHLKPHV